jgi:hypothetical protein
VLNKLEAERFGRIRRETLNGYGITLKDLFWLVQLMDKLTDKPTDKPIDELIPEKQNVRRKR